MPRKLTHFCKNN